MRSSRPTGFPRPAFPVLTILAWCVLWTGLSPFGLKPCCDTEASAYATELTEVRVTSDFPGGNVCAVDIQRVEDVYEIRFAADPRGGTEALWFYFRVTAPPGATLALILTNPDTLLGGRGSWAGVHPVARELSTDANPTGPWRRLSGGTMRELADGRSEVAWQLTSSTRGLEFAFSFPYGLKELEETLAACSGYWRVDRIGVSSRGRPVLRLSNSYGHPERPRPGVLLVARQHAGETPGSWVLDGLLRAAPAEISPEELLLWVIPFANVDGVVDGDYGKDPHPMDLNRDWASPMPMRYEVSVIRRDIDRFSQRTHLVAAIDLHAPGAREADGVYFQMLKPGEDQARAARQFVDALVPHLPDELMAREPLRLASYASRWNEQGTLGRYLWNRFQIPAPALEVPYSRARTRVLEIEDYRQMGAALAKALKHFAQSIADTQPE